jgi:hypothetical protein
LGSLNPYLGLLTGQLLVALFSGSFLLGHSAIWFGVSYMLIGGYRLFRSMVLAFTRPLVHPGETGLLFGILETIAAVSIILAPLISGLLYDRSPVLVYWVALGGILFMLLVNSFYLRKIRYDTRLSTQEESI